MQFLIDNLTSLIAFFWAGTVVLIIMITSFIKDRKNRMSKEGVSKNSANISKPMARWVWVFILAIIQTGCLEIMAGLDTIGSGGKADQTWVILFVGIVVIWFVIEFFRYRGNNNRT